MFPSVAGNLPYSSETGTRHLPLIDSIPYIKDYLQDGQAGNPNALLFSVEGGKSFGKLVNEDPNISYQDRAVNYPTLFIFEAHLGHAISLCSVPQPIQ